MLPTLSHFKIEQKSSPVCLQVWSPLLLNLNRSNSSICLLSFIYSWAPEELSFVGPLHYFIERWFGVSSTSSLEIFVILVPHIYILYSKNGKSEKQSRQESSDILDDWMDVQKKPQWKEGRRERQFNSAKVIFFGRFCSYFKFKTVSN